MDETEPSSAEILGAAALIGLDIPPECLPGVTANLQALTEHLRNVEAHEPGA